MTAPVFLIDPADLPAPDADRVVLTGREGHHAADVRRLRPGEAVHLTDGQGRRLRCTVLEVSRGRLELRVDEREQEESAQPRLVVAQALVKQEAAERALATLTEVGVDEVLPWAAAHSVVAWDGERAERGLRRWRAAVTQAAKQSRRAWVPVVGEPLELAGLVGRARRASLTVLLDTVEAVPAVDLDVPASGEVLLVVGPEGGVADHERTALVQAGARVASLGPTVLRSATAGTVAAAVLLSGTARWRTGAAAGGRG